ncbi:MAG: membrane dipeptidase [Gammaproteobacteria bacterium]|nr:membrane dipeptidase [Gammaproteobacteria bacterium]
MARISTVGTPSCGEGADQRREPLEAALKLQLDEFLVWDNHTYTTPSPGTRSIEELRRHFAAGFDVAFLNIGDADRSLEHVVRLASFYRRWIRGHESEFILLDSVAEIDLARATGRMAIAFDIEGAFCLGDQADIVELLYELGVRWMALAYNRRNLVGSGVHDEVDGGLTPFGVLVADEMDRVGMIKCLSHTGYRTAMDVLERSTKPCIFSHSNPRALWDHERNIPDALIVACAETGGVVGINGINIFLGDGSPTAESMVRSIDYVVELAGIDHVGLGFDSGYLSEGDIGDFLSDPAFWPEGNDYDKLIECVPPESIGAIVEGLSELGYKPVDIAKVLGGNMRRVAERVWLPGHSG